MTVECSAHGCVRDASIICDNLECKEPACWEHDLRCNICKIKICGSCIESCMNEYCDYFAVDKFCQTCLKDKHECVS